MKVLKLIGGYIALAGFFIFVDQSGIGIQKNINAVKKWRPGKPRSCTSSNIGKNRQS